MAADDEWRGDPPKSEKGKDDLSDDDLKTLDELVDILFDDGALHSREPDSKTPLEVENDDSESITKLGESSSRTLNNESDKEKSPTTLVLGGFSFFLSLAAILPSGILVLILALYTWHSECTAVTGYFIGAIVVGSILGKIFIRGHISVLLHEFKHQLISNLVGNKAKKLHVEANSGHFEYAYSKKTSHYNAFISVAPYIVPLFTFIAVLLALAFGRTDHSVAVYIVGLGYGVDLLLNIRDISPVQTDITEIRGGYKVGVLYISAWNLLIAGVLLAWVFHGIEGFSMLLQEFAAIFLYLHQSLTGQSLSGQSLSG